MSSNDEDDFKSADNKIPDRGSLYLKAMDIFDNQYAVFDQILVPENQWIFENNLEFFKLKIEDVDRLYSFESFNANNDDFIKTTLYVRIKQQQQRGDDSKTEALPPPAPPLYVIFSQFDYSDREPLLGWILVTTNFNFFVEQYLFLKNCTEDEKKYIYKFWYDDNEGIEKYQHDYSITKGNYAYDDDSDPSFPRDFDPFPILKNPQRSNFGLFPQCLERSIYENVASKDFGFYTFRFVPPPSPLFIQFSRSFIYNKFERYHREINFPYFSRIINNNNNIENYHHPNFKSAVPNINNALDLNELVGDVLKGQYSRCGRTSIPQHEWIYENKLEFFKLNIKDIDRLYFLQREKDSKDDDYCLFGVRVEYEKKYFLYVIFSRRRINKNKSEGTIYITTNPDLFANTPEVVSFEQKYNNIYKLLSEDDDFNGSTPSPLNLACREVISFNYETKLQSQCLKLPQILQRNIKEFINSKNAFGRFKYYSKYDSYKSRIFNKFKNKFFISV